MEELPEDLWIEILVKVPAVSVRGFRRVSRFFKELIDSPDFIRKHNANQSSSIKSECKFLVISDPDSHQTSCTKLDPSSHLSVVSIRIPNYDIVGCCQGILALRYRKPESGLVFWNPLTRSCRRLDDTGPEERGRRLGDTSCRYYFGHDSVSDDLKLVKIRHDGWRYQGHVYSSRTDSWKGIKIGLNHVYFYGYPYTNAVKGSNAIHIVASKRFNDKKRILAFDLATHVFSLVPLSKHMPFFVAYDMSYMTSLNGCLCFHARNERDFVVWRMNQYGRAESWSEFLRISYSSIMVALDFVDHRREVLLVELHRAKLVIYSYNVDDKELIQRTSENQHTYLSPRHWIYSPSLKPAALEFYKTDIVM